MNKKVRREMKEVWEDSFREPIGNLIWLPFYIFCWFLDWWRGEEGD